MTTYTPIARLPIMTPGDPAVRNAWGTILNAAFPLIEQLAAGNGPLDITGLSAYTLTTANDAADQARQAILPFIGSLSADCTVTIPPVARIGWVTNSTSGNANVVLTTGTAGGATLIVSPGSTLLYSCDGINVTSVSLGASGPLNATPGVLVGNGSWYAGKDTGGITRNLLSLGADNITHLRAGSVGMRLENQAGTVTFLVINPDGTATLSNSLVLSAGGLVVSNGSVSASTDLSVGRDGTIGRNLTVVGTGNMGVAHVIGLLTSGSLNVSGDTGLTGNLSVGLNTGISGSLTVVGDITGHNAILNGAVVSGLQTSLSGTSTFLAPSGVFNQAWTVGIGLNVLNGVAANIYVTVSDGRLKSNIQDITPADGMRYVSDARPRTFIIGGAPSAGFIAQEELASEARAASVASLPDDRAEFRDSDGVAQAGHRLTKDYQHDIAYLTAAIQGVMMENASLKARVEALERAPR